MKIPPTGERTPLAEFTAVREKEPDTGIDETKEPRRLLAPIETISWLASTRWPFATDFAIATASMTATNAAMKIDEFNVLQTSRNSYVWLL